jgi:hypothetical protein
MVEQRINEDSQLPLLHICRRNTIIQIRCQLDSMTHLRNLLVALQDLLLSLV